MDVGDPGRLHLPRPVHRPRPHLRQDQRDARREHLAGRSCCRAARRASTSTRSTAPGRRTRSRPSSTRPTASTSRWARPSRPAASRPRTASTCRAAPARTAAKKRKAIIPDPRNDENLAVAQTHLAFIRFHNRVVDTPARVASRRSQRFAAARELVTKHYQWMIRTDYLPRICRPSRRQRRLHHGRKVFEVGATPTDVPTMPIEFSVAAFRLGHSMIRRAYNWNRVFDDGAGTLDLLFIFSARQRRPRRRARGCRATGSPTSAASTTSARPASPTWPCRRPSSTARCASTRRSSNPLENLPPGRSAGPTCRSTTRARTSPSAT